LTELDIEEVAGPKEDKDVDEERTMWSKRATRKKSWFRVRIWSIVQLWLRHDIECN
jgi:hypothetical protein